MTKSKIFTMIFLTAILAVSLVLAGTSNPTTLTFTEPTTTLNAALSSLNTGVLYDIVTPTINQANNAPITLTVSGSEVAGSVLTTSGTTSSITVTAGVDYNEIEIGESYTGNIVLTEQSPGTDTVTIPVEFIGSFCSDGEVGNDLEISDVSIDNDDGDDDEWSPRDRIKVEVEVTNNNNDDKIKDVFVEIALFDSTGKDVTNDLDFTGSEDEEIDLGSIKDDDEDTAVFEFDVPADFEDDNYKLVIKAYSDDLGEDTECTASSNDLSDEFFESINGEREEDEEKHIIVDNIKVSPNPAQCSEIVQVTAEAFNIGDADYEDQIRITVNSEDLGVNNEIVIREDFDEGDNELFDFEFTVPGDAEEKLHTIEFRTYYDYDDDDDSYDEVSDEKFITQLRVAGNCNVQNSNAIITANLGAETPKAVAGKQVIINSNVRNTGDVATTYTVSVTGNTDWSSLNSIEPQTLTLNPGESRDVSIALTINENTSGDNELTIRAVYDGKTTDQRVVLSVTGATGSTSDADLGPFVNHLRDNWFIYLIVLVNIVLIIAIILVIRSMVSPRPL